MSAYIVPWIKKALLGKTPENPAAQITNVNTFEEQNGGLAGAVSDKQLEVRITGSLLHPRWLVAVYLRARAHVWLENGAGGGVCAVCVWGGGGVMRCRFCCILGTATTGVTALNVAVIRSSRQIRCLFQASAVKALQDDKSVNLASLQAARGGVANLLEYVSRDVDDDCRVVAFRSHALVPVHPCSSLLIPAHPPLRSCSYVVVRIPPNNEPVVVVRDLGFVGAEGSSTFGAPANAAEDKEVIAHGAMLRAEQEPSHCQVQHPYAPFCATFPSVIDVCPRANEVSVLC